MTTSSDDAKSIASELNFGEEVLWSGRPVQGIIFRPLDVFLVPLSVAIGGAILFNLHGSVFDSAASILFAFFITFGRFLIDRYVRAHTYFAVTAERALVSYQGRGLSSMRSFRWSKIEFVSFHEGKGQRGTIKFGRSGLLNTLTKSRSPFSSSAFDLWFPDHSNEFEGVDNAFEVYSLITDLRRSATGSRSDAAGAWY